MSRVLLIVLLLSAGSFGFASMAKAQQSSELDTSPVKAKNGKLPEAKRLFERVTGMKVPMNDSRVHQMALLISKNDFEGAAKIAVSDPAFINVRARNLAIRLSNKAYSPSVPFNDSAALMLGIIRDNADFRQALTANYSYELKSSTGYRNNFQTLLGNPWSEADSRLLDLNSDLVKVNGQIIGLEYNQGLVSKINANTSLSVPDRAKLMNESAVKSVNHPDPAGIFTTRYFAEAQFSGGSNRRPVEYVVKNFLCSSLSDIGNNMASDAYVGKDVDRFPGGDHSNYTNNCKNCHTVMDGYRMAFSKMTFNNWTADQVGSQGAAHGSLAGPLNDRRNFWLREQFNMEPLIQEVPTKGMQSKLLQILIQVIGKDVFIATASIQDGAPATIELARADQLKQLTDLMISARVATNATARDAAYAKAVRYNRFMSGLGLSNLVWTSLAADSDLRSELKIQKTSGFLKSDFPTSWQQEEVTFGLILGGGDFIFNEALSQYIKKYSANLESLVASRNLAANISLYSDACLKQIVNSSGANDFPAFLKCDVDFRKDKSFLAQFIIAKMQAAKASSVAVRGFESLIKMRGYALPNGAFNNARAMWYDYLRSIDQLIYFNAQAFDPTTGVHNKMNAGLYEFGFTVKDDTFYNLAASSYGWRGPNANGGKGMFEFGRMISDSEAFSRCVTQKVIHSVCYRDLSQDPASLKKWAAVFEASKYSVRELTLKVSIDPVCAIVKRGAL